MKTTLPWPFGSHLVNVSSTQFASTGLAVACIWSASAAWKCVLVVVVRVAVILVTAVVMVVVAVSGCGCGGS